MESLAQALGRLFEASQRSGEPVTETIDGIPMTLYAAWGDTPALIHHVHGRLKKAASPEECEAIWRVYRLGRTMHIIMHCLNYRRLNDVWEWLKEYEGLFLHDDGAYIRAEVVKQLCERLHIDLPRQLGAAPTHENELLLWHITYSLITIRNSITS